MTFEDTTLLGCSKELNKADFETFCSSANLNDVVMFNNIIDNLGYVGIFGNANPHFIKDWMEVVKDPSIESKSASLSGVSNNICTLTGALRLDFFMADYGTTMNP